MRAAHAMIVLILLLLVLTTARSDDEVCRSEVCRVAEAKYGLGDRTIRDAREKTFATDDGPYTLVRIEYGDTLECDELDDENCS